MPRSPQDGQTRLQEGVKTAQHGSKTAEETPQNAQEATKSARYMGPRGLTRRGFGSRAPETPNMFSKCFKVAPRRPHESPNGLQEGPKRPLEPQEIPK